MSLRRSSKKEQKLIIIPCCERFDVSHSILLGMKIRKECLFFTQGILSQSRANDVAVSAAGATDSVESSPGVSLSTHGLESSQEQMGQDQGQPTHPILSIEWSSSLTLEPLDKISLSQEKVNSKRFSKNSKSQAMRPFFLFLLPFHSISFLLDFLEARSFIVIFLHILQQLTLPAPLPPRLSLSLSQIFMACVPVWNRTRSLHYLI